MSNQIHHGGETAGTAAAVSEFQSSFQTGVVRTGALERYAYAADASHYSLTPEAVVVAEDTDHVAAVMKQAWAHRLPVTFRSGGTSLSGQATSNGVLIDVRSNFRGMRVLDDGARVWVQPGATVRAVNAALARFGHRLGPDPASEIAATVGGVIANNSSGMACGTVENTYQTLESMVVVLPSGTRIDTAQPDADKVLFEKEPELCRGLLALRERVVSNASSVSRIEELFSMKNTMGYGINALTDFSSPAAILQHLMIGSEGTLGFVAEAVFRTVRIKPLATTALAIFDTLEAANRALPDLLDTTPATLELLDSTSLRVGQSLAGAPAEIAGLQIASQAALLIEYHSDDVKALATAEAAALAVLEHQPLNGAATFSSNASTRAAQWKLRKGLYASVAGARPVGTTALLEDIVVPVPQLADTCLRLQELFGQYAYTDAVIFGHAKDGNIHFMVTDRFESGSQLERLSGFTDDLVTLVLGAGGSLKAEHGTGRAMAPFVKVQYGAELYAVMQQIKMLFDPRGLLNPGVLLSDEPASYLQHIKAPEPVEDEVNRCVECGYCEPICPSKNLTLTPRQRIVLRRASAKASRDGDTQLSAELARDYDYAGIQTCAVDGMCGTSCPVGINTGLLVKRLRGEEHGPASKALWTTAAKSWSGASQAGSIALSVAKKLPSTLPRAASSLGRSVLGTDTVPLYSADLPAGGAKRHRASGYIGAADAEPSGIYVSACVNTMFGPERDEHTGESGIGVAAAFERLCERAGVKLLVPDAIDGLCCGTTWTSKGFSNGHEAMAKRVAAAIDQLDVHQLPLISDASSCTEGFSHTLAELRPNLTVIDAVDFAAAELLPRLAIDAASTPSLTLHPTCSSTQMGLNPALQTLAEAISGSVHTPLNWGCCAFAGDRGMLHPELTASATAAEASDVAALGSHSHASCNRTCELGISRATGRSYQHILELLELASR